jgi:hypothetical protein
MSSVGSDYEGMWTPLEPISHKMKKPHRAKVHSDSFGDSEVSDGADIFQMIACGEVKDNKTLRDLIRRHECEQSAMTSRDRARLSPGRGKEKNRDKDKERDREKDSDRNREREREKERDRDRERERERERISSSYAGVSALARTKKAFGGMSDQNISNHCFDPPPVLHQRTSSLNAGIVSGIGRSFGSPKRPEAHHSIPMPPHYTLPRSPGPYERTGGASDVGPTTTAQWMRKWPEIPVNDGNDGISTNLAGYNGDAVSSTANQTARRGISAEGSNTANNASIVSPSRPNCADRAATEALSHKPFHPTDTNTNTNISPGRRGSDNINSNLLSLSESGILPRDVTDGVITDNSSTAASALPPGLKTRPAKANRSTSCSTNDMQISPRKFIHPLSVELSSSSYASILSSGDSPALRTQMSDASSELILADMVDIEGEPLRDARAKGLWEGGISNGGSNGGSSAYLGSLNTSDSMMMSGKVTVMDSTGPESESESGKVLYLTDYLSNVEGARLEGDLTVNQRVRHVPNSTGTVLYCIALYQLFCIGLCCVVLYCTTLHPSE